MKLYWLTRLSLGLMLATVLFSCKKEDNNYNTDRVIAEFTDAAAGGAISLDYSTTELELDLAEVRLFMRSWAKKDVVVKIQDNAAAVGDYNTENGTSYLPYPSSGYRFVDDSYTLTQDDRAATVKIRLRPSDLLGANYAIGLSISSVENGEVSETAKKIVIAVSVKNKYDGVYNVTGTVVDAAGLYGGFYPNDGVELRTVGANAVDYHDPFWLAPAPFGSNCFVIEEFASGGGAWLFSPRFVFNTTTDKCTQILDVDGLVPFGTPGTPNQFTITNPNTKNFQIRYTAIAGRFTITETYTYVGPRQ
jgi:hypothetical protein